MVAGRQPPQAPDSCYCCCNPAPYPPVHRLDLIARPRRRRVGINPSDLQSIRERRVR